MPNGGLNVPLWAAVTLLAVGGLFVVLGLLTLNSARRKRRSWMPMTGQVIGSRFDGDGHLRLQVEYRNSGRRSASGTGSQPAVAPTRPARAWTFWSIRWIRPMR
jgi:hypothetical protein